MNDPQIAIYFALVNPKNTIQYGGVTVGPIIKEALTSSFSILNISKQTGGIELDARYWIDKKTYKVENYIGKNIKEIKHTSKYQFSVLGNSGKVIAQTPSAGSDIIEGGTVILYLEDYNESQ